MSEVSDTYAKSQIKNTSKIPLLGFKKSLSYTAENDKIKATTQVGTEY